MNLTFAGDVKLKLSKIESVALKQPKTIILDKTNVKLLILI